MRELVRIMKQKAGPVGPMHSFWDLIGVMEARLQGRNTLLHLSDQEFVDLAESYLRETERG